MKRLVLAFALFLSVASASTAGTIASGTVSSASTLARDLANSLQLNEMQYLKIKDFESKKLAAIKTAVTTLTGDALVKELVTIEATFSGAVMQVLTADQQKAYLAMKPSEATSQMALGK